MKNIKLWAESLKRNSYALYLAARDPRVSPIAKILIMLIVAYVLSPIYLIPDFIPVIGYLDDLLILPLGIALVIRMIPAEVWQNCRQQASTNLDMESPYRTQVIIFIVIIWLLALSYTASICWQRHTNSAI